MRSLHSIQHNHCRTISHALHIKQDGVVDIIYSTATSTNISLASIVIANLVLILFF